MQKIFVVFSFLLSTVLVSCIEDVDPKNLKGAQEMVVVSGLLSPSDPFVSVEVSRSKSVVGKTNHLIDKEDYIIKNAEVTITDSEGNAVTLPYDGSTFTYQIEASEFPVSAGKTYHLSVVVESKTYTSQCTIPVGKADELEYQIASKSDYENELIIRFNDIVGNKHYYRVGAEVTVSDYSYPVYFDLQGFQTDAAGDGSRISAKGEIFSSLNPGDEVRVVVATVEEILYRYQYASFNYVGDDPFSEPVVFPSNISGGLGIFAGYQLEERIFTVE